MRDGVQIGAANWFAKEQVLIWDIPGVTSGSLTADQLKSFGGWPFTPDAEWLNLQTIAFYHFKTAIDKQGSVASAAARALVAGSCARLLRRARPGERAGLRRLALAGRHGASVLLRRARPLLREVRMRLQVLVAVVVELDVHVRATPARCGASRGGGHGPVVSIHLKGHYEYLRWTSASCWVRPRFLRRTPCWSRNGPTWFGGQWQPWFLKTRGARSC